MTKLTQTCLCLTLNKKNGNHWQDVRPSTSESSGLNLHFAFFKLIRTLEENILHGFKIGLKSAFFTQKSPFKPLFFYEICKILLSTSIWSCKHLKLTPS